MVTEECGPVDRSENGGILAGFALLDTGEPAPGVRISVRWQAVVERLWGFVTVDNALTTTELRGDGFFLFCGVPRIRPVEIIAVWNGVESRCEPVEPSKTQRVSRGDLTIRGGP